MTASQLIDKWLDETQSDLVSNYKKMKLKASGKWGNSLEQFKESNKDGFRFGIKGENYTQWIVPTGRGKNRDQSDEGIRGWVGWAGSTFLDQWVKDKGISANPFAVAWKIAREGWDVPNRYNDGELLDRVLTDERISKLNRDISLFLIDDIKSKLIKRFDNGSK